MQTETRITIFSNSVVVCGTPQTTRIKVSFYLGLLVFEWMRILRCYCVYCRHCENFKSQACNLIPCDGANTPHSFVHQWADCIDFKYRNVMPMARCIRIDFVIDRNAMRSQVNQFAAEVQQSHKPKWQTTITPPTFAQLNVDCAQSCAETFLENGNNILRECLVLRALNIRDCGN